MLLGYCPLLNGFKFFIQWTTCVDFKAEQVGSGFQPTDSFFSFLRPRCGPLRKFPTRPQFRTRTEAMLCLLFTWLEHGCFTVLSVSAVRHWASATCTHLPPPRPCPPSSRSAELTPVLQQLPTSCFTRGAKHVVRCALVSSLSRFHSMWEEWTCGSPLSTSVSLNLP